METMEGYAMSFGSGGYKYYVPQAMKDGTLRNDAELACADHDNLVVGCLACKGRCLRLMNGIETR